LYQNICLFGFIEEWYYLPDWLAGNIIIHYPRLRQSLEEKELKILYWIEYVDGYFVSKGFKVLKTNNNNAEVAWGTSGAQCIA
jgi:hypothetical protein